MGAPVLPTSLANYSSGSASSSATSSGNWPVTSAGDIVVISLGLTGNTAAAATLPAGWNSVCDVSVGTTNGNFIRLYGAWIRCTGVQANPVWSGLTGYRFFHQLVVRDCVSSGTPFTLSASDVKSTASTSWPPMALGTATKTDNLCVYIGAGESATNPQMSAWANSALANVTEVYDVAVAGSSSTGASRMAAAGDLLAGGDTGSMTATQSSGLAAWFGLCFISDTSTDTTPATFSPDFFNLL